MPGSSAVPVAGRVLDAADMQGLVEASLDLWLTAGRFTDQFEADLAEEMMDVAELPDEGPAEAVTLHQNGRDMRGPRVEPN